MDVVFYVLNATNFFDSRGVDDDICFFFKRISEESKYCQFGSIIPNKDVIGIVGGHTKLHILRIEIVGKCIEYFTGFFIVSGERFSIKSECEIIVGGHGI